MKLGSVQFLRAIAAILVVYRHCLDQQPLYLPLSRQAQFIHLRQFGAFGVDLFFVISGFIISYSAGRYRGPKEAGRFLYRRFLRLNPIYYLATLLFLIVYSHHDPSYLSFPLLIKSIVLLPIFDTGSFIDPILTIGWTLSFEWYFYCLFALGITLRRKDKTFFLLTTGGILLLTGLMLKSSNVRFHFLTNPLMGEFLLGVIIHYCWARKDLSAKAAGGMLLAGLAIFLYEMVKGIGWIPEHSCSVDGPLAGERFLYWGIPAGLLVAGCIFLEKRGKGSFLWYNKTIMLLGDSSYSLYLTHLISFIVILGLSTRIHFPPAPDLINSIRLLLAIGTGVLFYWYVERPWLNYLRRIR